MLRLRTAALLFACCSAIALGCSTTAPTTAPASSPVVAEFGGEQLTLAEFEDRYARSSGTPTSASADSLAAYEDFLQRYVDFRLKVREARRLGLDEDPEIVREIREYRDQLAAPYLIQREVMDGIVQDLYEKQQEEVSAAHILLFVDAHAAPADTLAAYHRLDAIRDSITAGALAFETAARRHSDDPSRVQNNGNLGWFTGGRMILPFEEMAYSTPVGEVSPVFRTQFGFHILKVTGRREASGELRAAHILLRLSEDSTPSDSAAAYTELRELRERVLAGQPFEELARTHSQDPGSAPRGGDLGYFTRDRMVEPFAEAAFALESPGDLSDIVETPFGLHLIQLIDHRTPPSYEERYSELRRIAEGLPRTRERRQEVGRTFRAEAGSRLDSAAVRQAVAGYPRDSILTRVLTSGFEAPLDRPFASIGDSTITLGEFGQALRGYRPPPSADQEALLFSLADQYLNERAVALATHSLEARDPEFRRVMQDFTDGVLLFRISEDSIWTAASRDTLGLRAFHAERAGEYRFPERRRVLALYSPSDSLLTLAGQLIDEGVHPVEAAARLQLAGGEPAALRIDTLRIAPPAAPPFLRALTLEPGKRTPPLSHRSERVMLYVEALEPPRQMEFEEAYAQVVSDYQEELERRFVERLRRESEVRLYPERLSGVFRGGASPAPSPAVSSLR